MPEKFESSPTEQVVDFELIRQQALEKLFAFENEKFFIDSGGVGKVYDLPGGFCLKVMEARHKSPNRDILDLGNTPHQEGLIQERIASTQYQGKTRAPKMFGVIEIKRPDIDGAIIMERLDAVNLNHVILGRADVPENFDIEDFFEDLDRFTIHMHENLGIVHDDLFARNVMIASNGEPRVIDFGRSKYLTSIPDPLERERLANRDLERLFEAYNKLSKTLQNR